MEILEPITAIRRACRSCCLPLVLALGATPLAAQTVWTLAPNQDAQIASDTPDSNFGADDELLLGTEPTPPAGPHRILLDFDLDVLPHTNLRRATLSLWFLGGVTGHGANAILQPCTEPWDEGAVTWNAAPTANIGSPWAQTTVAASASPHWDSWDVHNLVVKQAEGTLAAHGWLLRLGSEASDDEHARYPSREYALDPALRPKLEIEFYDLLLEFEPLVVGANEVRVSGAAAGAQVVLFASTLGDGSTPLPHFGVVSELEAAEALLTAVADASGLAVFAVDIAQPSAGQPAYLQAVSAGRISNVLASIVGPAPCLGRLLPADLQAAFYFGTTVALDENGQQLVVGDPRGHFNQGRVHYYRRDDSGTPLVTRDDTWTLQAELGAPDPDSDDFFGSSLAISGDTLLIGAPKDDGAGLNGGAVYVYRRHDAGTPHALDDDTWVLQEQLLPRSPVFNQHYGWSVCLAGDEAVIGEPDAVGQQGAVHVFHRDDAGTPAQPADDVWSERARLVPGDAGALKHFGWWVDLEGDDLVVGAPRDHGGVGNYTGAVYTFRRRDNDTPGMHADDTWAEHQKLQEPTPGTAHHFGETVAVADGWLLVGALSGSAQLYRRSASGPSGDVSWVEHQTLSALHGLPSFGLYVALSGERALLGSPEEEPAGAAWIYRRNDLGTLDRADDVWSVEARLDPQEWLEIVFDEFGSAVALAGDLLVVGYPGDVVFEGYLGDLIGEQKVGSVRGFHLESLGPPLLPAAPSWVVDACAPRPPVQR